MNIAIYGAGSIGTILGAFLAKNGIDADLISRNKAHVAGLKEKGARITGTVELTVPVRAMTPEEVTKKYDLIFLTTKTVDNKNNIYCCAEILNEGGIICTMQNGLPEMSVADVIGDDKTFGCAIAWGATMRGEGICELTSEPDSITFSLGSLKTNADSFKIASIKNILSVMGRVDTESNFIGARWSKLLINASFSGMSAAMGCTFGEAARNRKSRKCIQKIIKECIDVATAAKIKIEPVQGKDIVRLLDYNNVIKEFISFIIIPIAIRKHRLLKASMLQDLEKGKKCEVEGINGAVCEYGRRFDVPTPYNDIVVRIINDIEKGKIKPGFENLKIFSGI